jgi:hypothetical protein
MEIVHRVWVCIHDHVHVHVLKIFRWNKYDKITHGQGHVNGQGQGRDRDRTTDRDRHRRLGHGYVFMSMSTCEFCMLISTSNFQRLFSSLSTDNFQRLNCLIFQQWFKLERLFSPEKSGIIPKLLSLRTFRSWMDNCYAYKPGQPSTETFSAYSDPLNGPNQQKLHFESNLPSAALFRCFELLSCNDL